MRFPSGHTDKNTLPLTQRFSSQRGVTEQQPN
uniref:Uncharacterized protein n=1 Tax=Anguilla anguilla TaxID=7936 RepID=A0A0E9U7S0_ANGAN